MTNTHHISAAPRKNKPRIPGCASCLLLVLAVPALIFILLTAYLLAPMRTDMLILGIDRVPEGTALGRSDTMILVSVYPLFSTVKMLSIPRDLWVNIPGVGENRINTAHFFAEAAQPGSGPQAAARTVAENFEMDVPYYARLRFDAVLDVVDALGGVTLNLPQDMGGLPAGTHYLNGEQALAFIRDRQGTDDFFRMEHSLFMVRAILDEMLAPASWPRLPAVARAAFDSIDSNLPAWQMPRVGVAMVRAALTGGLESRTIRREMTTPTITSGGANVLMPNWDQIHPYVREMFPR
jgi:LCP family protein required for cell wall assembly